MKKLLAVFLCVICLFSSMAVMASAEDSIITTIGSILGLEPDEDIGHGITYDSNKLYSGVSKVMYEPKPTVTIRSKGTYTITSDIPLSVDYQFVAWQDRDTGKLYYAGDKYYVEGQKTFYAVWEEKTDNYTRPIRVFLTAMETFKRSIQSFFNVFKVEFVEDPTAGVIEDNRFDVELLIYPEAYNYAKGTRTFTFKVRLDDGATPYHSFSRTEEIFLGGEVVFEQKKVLVPKTDWEGKLLDGNNDVVKNSDGKEVYADNNGNLSIKNDNGEYISINDSSIKIIYVEAYVFENVLQNSKKYSALYETRGAADVTLEDVYKDIVDENGVVVGKELVEEDVKFQTIRVTLTDGVPGPLSSAYVTFVLPAGILSYYAGDTLKASNAYNYRILTSPNLE